MPSLKAPLTSLSLEPTTLQPPPSPLLKQPQKAASALTGQLTATDVDAGDTLSYATTEPIDGLTIDEQTGAWSFDPSVEAYNDLAKAGATRAITVDYTVTDGLRRNRLQLLHHQPHWHQ